MRVPRVRGIHRTRDRRLKAWPNNWRRCIRFWKLPRRKPTRGDPVVLKALVDKWTVEDAYPNPDAAEQEAADVLADDEGQWVGLIEEQG